MLNRRISKVFCKVDLGYFRVSHGLPKNSIIPFHLSLLFQGELTFTEAADGHLSIGGPVKECVTALGVTQDALKSAMAGRILSAGGDLVSKEHSLSDAHYTRLALAKAAYDRLFTWIVQQVTLHNT